MSKIFNKDFIVKNRVSILLSVVLTAFFVVENINGRFWLSDFKVYYSAASRIMEGGNIYNEAFGLGSGYYKYSPFVSIFFIPFLLFPFDVAAIIYFFIVAALIIYLLNVSLVLIIKDFGEGIEQIQRSKIILFFGFLIAVVHLQRELHLGNVNVLLLSILLFSIKGIKENKIILPAILIGIAVLFKPHFLILFPLLLIGRKFKVLFISTFTIFIGLLIPSFILGLGKDVELHGQWLETMKLHNAGIINAEQTLYFLLNHYCLRFFINDSRIVFVVAGILILASLLPYFYLQMRKTKLVMNDYLITNSFLLSALIS